jgi:serine protease Do
VVTHRPGDTVGVKYWRSGSLREATTKIALPPDQGRDEGIIATLSPMQGAKVANITPALADEMQKDLMARGVIVTDVQRGSQAARFGIEPGDMIRQLNGNSITSVAQLKRGLAATDSWQMSVQRGDRMLQLDVQ